MTTIIFRQFQVKARVPDRVTDSPRRYQSDCALAQGVSPESLVRGGGEMPKKVSATGVLDPQQFRFRKRVWAVGEVATLTLQTGRCWKLKNWSPRRVIAEDKRSVTTRYNSEHPARRRPSSRRRNLLRVLNVVTREFLISVELFPGRRKESDGGSGMEIFEFLDWQGVTPNKELGVVVHVLYLL